MLNTGTMAQVGSKGRLWKATLALILGILFFKGLAYQLELCAFPYQLLPMEAGPLQSARALQAGLDPWAPQQAPEYANVYGIVVPAVAAFLAHLSPTSDLLLLIRLCSGLAAFFALGLLFWTLRSQGVEVLTAAAAVLSIYLSLLWGDTLAGRSDGIAVALFIVAVILASREGWDWACLAGCLAAFSALAKPYAILALPLGLVLAWSAGRRRDASVMLASFAGAGLLEIGLMTHSFPLYFLATFFSHANDTHYSLRWFFFQLSRMAEMHAALLLLWLGACVAAWRGGRTVGPTDQARHWAWVAGLTVLVLACGPGGHLGAYVTYFNQLLVPFMVLALVLWLRQLKVPLLALALALALDGAVNLQMDQSNFVLNTDAQTQVWSQAEGLIAARPLGLYPPILVSTLLRHGAFIADTDHTRLLYLSQWGKHPSALRAAAMERHAWIDEGLRLGRFQAVVCGEHWPCPENWPNARYRLAGPPLCLRTPVYFLNNCFSVYLPVKEPGRP